MPGASGVYGITKSHTFHSAATAAADGAVFNVGAYKSITVDLNGTVTSATVEFKGAGIDGVYSSIMGLKLSDWSDGTSATLAGAVAEKWTFPVAGLTHIIMDITAIVAGVGESLNIKAGAVA